MAHTFSEMGVNDDLPVRWITPLIHNFTLISIRIHMEKFIVRRIKNPDYFTTMHLCSHSRDGKIFQRFLGSARVEKSKQ